MIGTQMMAEKNPTVNRCTMQAPVQTVGQLEKIGRWARPDTTGGTRLLSWRVTRHGEDTREALSLGATCVAVTTATSASAELIGLPDTSIASTCIFTRCENGVLGAPKTERKRC
eukprot:3051381-Prymnesium_polylepis.1